EGLRTPGCGGRWSGGRGDAEGGAARDAPDPISPRLHRPAPSRSPAWGWERALNLVRTGRSFSRRDDALTGLAAAYLRALSRRRHESGPRNLPPRYRDVHAARRLHEQGGRTAVEAQARLLAGQPTEEVARITDVPPAVVKMYEGLFYNVTDRLHARDWVPTRAVGWWRFDPARGRDAATVLRAYAYHGGLPLIDAALPYLLGRRMDAQPGHGAM